jgi:hypothetical protein
MNAALDLDAWKEQAQGRMGGKGDGMKKSARLQRHYDKLTPDERFRLVVAAIARDDGSEIDALARTCPTKTYRMTDPDYTDKIQRAYWLLVSVEADLWRYGCALLWALTMMTQADLDANDDDEKKQADIDHVERYADIATQAATVAVVLWDGLAQFADDIGVEHSDLLSFSPDKLAAVERWIVRMARVYVDTARKIAWAQRGYLLAAQDTELTRIEELRIDEENAHAAQHAENVRNCATTLAARWRGDE